MDAKCVFALLLAAAMFAGDPPAKDPRLEALYSMFLSPCCWSETLAVHRSPEGKELRDEIRRRVEAGQTDEQVKEALIRAYSPRILAVPEGGRGQWLFWTPIAILMAGLLVVMALIRQWTTAPRRAV